MVPVFAMLLFGLCALGALVIDMGLAVLTQGQMQTVADLAALEGLRLRDAVDANGQPLGDQGRRQAAAQAASLVFDDDLNPEAAPTQPYQLGAGPAVILSGGITELNASQSLSLPDQRTYLPAVQTNLTNQPHGDMVAGTFAPDRAGVPGVESADYQRTDFTPSDQVGSAAAPALLVRLRRTNDFGGLDNQAGISSSGPALPSLLGHGSMTPASNPDNPNDYNFRRHGFTVRATALADARPALRVGLPQPATATAPAVEGAMPFALDDLDFWAGLAVDEPAAATVDPASGAITSGGAVVGQFTPPAPDPNTLTTVGQPVVPAAPMLPPLRTGYVPLYRTLMENGRPVQRVVGFGRVAVDGDLPAITLTKLPAFMAPGNASRHLGPAPQMPNPAEVWPVLFAANRALAEIPGTVLAPALVR